jgi:(p)ppGpp synthase/HD superfamily hydrolase
MLPAALAFALAAHGDQTRKGSTVPYVSHLLQVSGLVFEHGGDIVQATAALLHDVVEDTPATIEEVAAAFGPEVAGIVADCTDTLADETPGSKRPWLARKQAYVAHLREVGPRSALVVGCDKLHNLRTLVVDLELIGPAVLGRFNAPPEQQRWLHGELLAALVGKVPAGLYAQLSGLVSRYALLVSAGS